MAVSEMVKIERSVFIKASRSRVWRALTKIEEFSQWFSVQAKAGFEAGKRVDMVSTHNSCKGTAFWLTVETMQPEEYFSWRWYPGSASPDDPNDSPTLVEFRLHEAEGGTMVTVTESGFDRISLERRAKAFTENEEGWKIQMASLERYVRETV